MIDWQKAMNWGLGSFAILWLGVTFWPVSFWFSVDHVTVSDAAVGETPAMSVSRTINRPFNATWRVELERQTSRGGFIFITKASGDNRYSLDSALPENLDLDWWTYPKTFRPSPGRYRIETCWNLAVAGTSHKPLCIHSNVFTIKGKDT